MESETKTKFNHSTHFGTLTGLQKAGHQAFLGIRYAQPPIGHLRFKPPQRIDAWDGVFDATQVGPAAPQAYPDNPPLQLEESEDCLILNIYTPHADNTARPVMVFIHGGGFIIDSGSRPRTYGGNLAEYGDVVVVTIEYRMGALGFLYAEGISPNLGLQDQVCALQWVQRHIADFGGDPANVTIFGESAGAMSIAHLLVMPAAQGLFHKAILESGSFMLEPPGQSLRNAQKSAQKFLKALNIPFGDLGSLTNIPLTGIMRAQKKVTGNSFFSETSFAPVHDGDILPADPLQEVRNGAARNISILIGTNEEEFPIFGAMIKNPLQQWVMKRVLFGWMKKMGLTDQNLRHLLPFYRKVLTPAQADQKREINYLVSDAFFRIPATMLADAHSSASAKTFFYCFAHPAPAIQAASHVMELYFVFGNLKTSDIAEQMKVPGTEQEVRLSQQMMKAWSSFARSGDPNHAELPAWPAYDKTRRSTMFFQIPPAVIDAPMEEVRSEWEKILTTSKTDRGTNANPARIS